MAEIFEHRGRWFIAERDPSNYRRLVVHLNRDDRRITNCSAVYGSVEYVASYARKYRTQGEAERALDKLEAGV